MILLPPSTGVGIRPISRPRVTRSTQGAKGSSQLIAVKDATDFLMVAPIKPAFNGAICVLCLERALHHRDVLPTEIGPAAALGVFKAGECDIDVRAGKIVDVDDFIAFDPVIGPGINTDK